jgi:hypothetical protein
MFMIVSVESKLVVAGLDPAIQSLDARVEPGHDSEAERGA